MLEESEAPGRSRPTSGVSRPLSGISRPRSGVSRLSDAASLAVTEVRVVRPASLLEGVSYDAEVQNELTNRGLRSLLHSDVLRQREHNMISQFRSSLEPENWGFASVDEQGFVRTSDHLCSSIEALRGRQAAFEGVPLSPGNEWSKLSQARKIPGIGGGARPQSATRRDGGRSEDEGVFDGTFAERLQAYKYYRRFEREEAEQLSPSATLVLSRNASSSGLGKAPKPRNSVVKYNASGDALERWFPEAKKEREASKKVARRTRAEEAGIQRQQQLMESSIRWAKEIKRKKDQGDAAQASRQSCLSDRAWSFLGSSSMSSPSSSTRDSSHGQELRAILAEQWIRLLVVISVAQEFAKSVQFAQHDHIGKMRLLAQQSKKSKRILMRNPMVREAVEMDALSFRLKPFSKCLTTLAICFRTAVQVKRKRHSAYCVLDCMKNWQFAGRTFVALRRFATWIRRLQRWWRQSSKRLRDHRDMVCARWERLEKASLAEEEQKRQDSYAKTGARFWGTTNTLVPEGVRTRFVENELRARRVALLPLLYIWEEDARRWRKDLEEWRETRVARKALGLDCGSMFRWPPTRPSYLPPAHPNHAAFGNCCPEDCPGRRGDADIIKMWRTARKHPKGGGWKKIPCADCNSKLPDAKNKSRQRGKASGQRSWEGGSAEAAKEGEGGAAPKASNSLFGDAATDEELRQWGIDAATLPGL